MNIKKRLELIEKEVIVNAIAEDEPADWREKEAQRMLPLIREIARCVQWENTPLPSDEELLRRELADLSRWPSQKEYLKYRNTPSPILLSETIA